MDILFALLGEHGVLKHQMAALRLAAPGFTDEQLRAAALVLAEAVETHAAIEDELLFTALDGCAALPAGPLAAMREEHRRIEELLSRVLAPPGARAPSGAGAPESRERSLLRLLETLLHHFAHEEHVLFPLAGRGLGAESREALGARWAQRRSVEIGAIATVPVL
jgi:iron-sulfur cluster repair protein YtfE (RIC family)